MEPLPDIDDAVGLTEADRPMVDELVAVLERHGAISRFGLTLLHQHFPIADDEALLETTDTMARTHLIRPMKKAELDGLDYKATAWRLDTGEPMMLCFCLVKDYEHTGKHQRTD